MEVHVFVGGLFVVEAGILKDDAEALPGQLRLTVGSRPSSSMRPLVGRRSVVSILMVVVLPAPLGPRKAKISPCATSKLMSLTAVKSPNVLTRLLTEIIRGSSSSPRFNTERFSYPCQRRTDRLYTGIRSATALSPASTRRLRMLLQIQEHRFAVSGIRVWSAGCNRLLRQGKLKAKQLRA